MSRPDAWEDAERLVGIAQKRWNEQADEFNTWDTLDFSEQVAIILEVDREERHDKKSVQTGAGRN